MAMKLTPDPANVIFEVEAKAIIESNIFFSSAKEKMFVSGADSLKS